MWADVTVPWKRRIASSAVPFLTSLTCLLEVNPTIPLQQGVLSTQIFQRSRTVVLEISFTWSCPGKRSRRFACWEQSHFVLLLCPGQEMWSNSTFFLLANNMKLCTLRSQRVVSARAHWDFNFRERSWKHVQLSLLPPFRPLFHLARLSRAVVVFFFRA